MLKNDEAKVLTGWKAIAAYLHVSVRYAYDLARKEGLPVRQWQKERHRVLALPDELDDWLAGRAMRPPARPGRPPVAS